VFVSNHGGRQLDGTVTTLEALPDVVKIVKGRIPVFVDGGFRRGTDIFKALALGADFVWIARPILWGLAYNGEEGVASTLQIFIDEFKRTMALSGCNSVKDITPSHLKDVSRQGIL
jgi:(S)-2-hydroxy-acid oxidase